MQGEDQNGEVIEARRDYLREQARERKRRQRKRAKSAHSAGPEGETVTPMAPQSLEDQRPETPDDPPRPLGRPKLWTPDKIQKWQDFLISRIEAGQTLTAVCRKHPKGPSLDTVWRWLRENATFAAAYDRAKLSAADALFWQSIDIADNATGDGPMISAARMRSEARRYAASKLKPESYGDRSEVRHVGAVAHVITDDMRARALASFVARQAINQAQSLPEVRKLIESTTMKDQPGE